MWIEKIIKYLIIFLLIVMCFIQWNKYIKYNLYKECMILHNNKRRCIEYVTKNSNSDNDSSVIYYIDDNY